MAASGRRPGRVEEGKVAGGMLKAFRTRYGLPSRKGHSKTLPIRFAPDGGTTQTEHVAPAEHPARVVLLKMRRAGILLGIPTGMWTYSPDIQDRTLAKGWGVIKNAARYYGLAFCRTLAKIGLGHAWAAAHHGIDSFTPLATSFLAARPMSNSSSAGPLRKGSQRRIRYTSFLQDLSSTIMGGFSS
jgi:hypothetical protein